jgi:hypothetical protein
VGAFLDLGEMPLVEVDILHPPSGFSAGQRTAWDELQQPDVAPQICTVCGRAPAVVGHTYLLRSILPAKHDVLVAFRPVDADEHGMSIAWRILRRFTP